MRILLKVLMSICLLISLTAEIRAYRVHCEEDSLKVMELIKISSKADGLGERMVIAAKAMEGIPLGKAADNDSLATVMINFHELDKLGFINNVMAIAMTNSDEYGAFKTYVANLENLSRKNGEDRGFASKLFYGADWIVDNVFRNNLKEMTEYMTGGGFRTKTLDYLSHHKDEFEAMKDSATAEKVKMTEMGYRSHRIPHLKKQTSGNKSLHEHLKTGDIIMMLTPETDYDIYDIGVIEMKEGVPYLIHISPTTGMVTADGYPLARLFKLEGQHFYGYRWLRAE